MTIVAMLGFAGLVFADSGNPVKPIGPGSKIAKPIAVSDEDATAPAGDNQATSSSLGSLCVPVEVLPHPGDRCDTAVPLTLNILVKATTATYGVHCDLNHDRPCSADADCSPSDIPPRPDDGACVKAAAAANDYQTPATAACYAGIGQFPTDATGRDIVFSFTAPADGSYTFRSVPQSPTDPVAGQNTALYLTDLAGCANLGTVTCLAGANHGVSNAFVSSKGASNHRGDAIACHPMTSGQTVYFVFDDGIAGKCSSITGSSTNNHNCFTDANCDAGTTCVPQDGFRACSDDNAICVCDANCNPGATCVPRINAGSAIGIEVEPCHAEVEPNDTPAQANPYVCEMTGTSNVTPVAHCYLGPRAGAVCTRSSFLDQSLPDSNMRCSISGARCAVNLATGVGNCLAGDGICQQQTDLDCDPRCDIGPNAGKTCGTQAFCNPGSDQGATCGGTCQAESTCIATATGADTGVACTPVCVGSSIPSVNGRYCSALSGCPGAGVCTTTPLVPTPGATCVAGQTCGRQYNEGDTDYYSLGAWPAGSKVFAAVNATSANDYDFRLRVTNETNTLQMDDDDVTSWYGSNSAVVAGAVTDGTPTYVQVARTAARESAPYLLSAVIRPPIAAAQLEDESGPTGNDIYFGWPGDVLNANPVAAGPNQGYVRGSFAFQGDSDCFKFLVNKGDLMDWYGDSNPTRVAGAASIVDLPQPIIYDAEPAGISNFVFGANPRKNTLANVQGPGLRALSPAVTSSWFQWRASYTGMLEVCYYGASALLGQGTPAHPNFWAGSLSVNCGPVQAAGAGTTSADVSLTTTGPAGPVETGQFVDYTITMTNNGTEIAQEVRLAYMLDLNLSFVSLTADDGFGGNNTACFSLPSQPLPGGPGGIDAPIDCINTSMAPGTTTTYVVKVQVNNCIGAGIDIVHSPSITTISTDPDTSNDTATTSFTTSAAPNNGCTDIVCAEGTCFPDLCTDNDHCEAGVCVTTKLIPNDNNTCSGNINTPCLTDAVCEAVGEGVCIHNSRCDDHSLCTGAVDGSGDTCSSATGCVFDSTNLGDLCDDFNACTANTCDPLLFCQFPANPASTSCDDDLACTGVGATDHCDGQGSCVGTSVCSDGNDCTDDFADEANACACSYANSLLGAPCDDNNACTGTGAARDSCNGTGGCVGGQAVSCVDNNACTDDSCDPGLGCVNTPHNCDDGNACSGVESCDTATGCVGGVPVICTASDQCHVVGVCDTQTGGCSNPNAPDGTTCDDGIAGTSGDNCQGGVCAGDPCTSTNNPRSKGWYKGLCHNSHSGDSLSNADAACVGELTETFAGITTIAQICEVLLPSSPNNDSCGKAEDQLMTLALNICKQRVCPVTAIDSACGDGSNATVGASLGVSDAIFNDTGRTTATCNVAECLDKEINNGHALELDTLMSVREGVNLRLNWTAPNVDDGVGNVNHYTIYRRAVGSKVPFVEIGTATGLTFLDVNTGTGSWEYDLVPSY